MTKKIFATETAQVVVIQVDAGVVEMRIVSPQTRAYVPLSSQEERCEALGEAMVDRAGRRLPVADQFELICKEQLVQQESTVVDGLPLIDLVERHEPLAILSGGYLQSFSPPQSLGFVKVAGDQLNPPHRSWLLSGVFCTDGLEWTIRPFQSADDLDNYADCVQAGPFLVRDGLDRYRSSGDVEDAEMKLVGSEQEQAFICLTAERNALLGYSTSVAASELSEFALEQLGCADALRLSGHVTAGLWLDGELHGNSEVPLTNAIAVFPAH